MTLSIRPAMLALAWLVAAPLAAQPASSPLHGSLAGGSHDVGFRTIALHDASRSRGIVAHVWYPARSGGAGPRMTYLDATLAHLEGASDLERRQREETSRRFFTQFSALSDAQWTTLSRTPLAARRDAPPAAGRFPLLIGHLRPLSTNVTNEHLASHGYVVAMMHGSMAPGDVGPGPGLDVMYRDMEFAIPEMRKLPYVDPASLGALGFSGAGFSQFLLAMRHPGVKAICDLESAIFDDERLQWPLSGGWGYDVNALRVPFLHTYSVPLSKLENRFRDFENMRYSTRHHYLVDAPGIHHWDFATEGMAASTVLGLRAAQAPRLRQAFETTNRYVLAFFDAYLKQDSAALAFLRRDPAANGAPAGLATIREISGVPPAPTAQEFEQTITSQGVAAAMKEFDAARARDPRAPLFREDQLNAMGYRLVQHASPQHAVAVFRKAVELYPGSTNTYDSLSEALEAAGDRAEALGVARRGLAALEAEALPQQRKQQLGDILRARVQRLQ